MTDLASAWTKVLRCLEGCVDAGYETDGNTWAAKEQAVDAIEKWNRLAKSKPNPQPDQRTCPKCGSAEHKLYYVSHIATIRCDELNCPDKQEHIHVVCCLCGYAHWQRCADHVELPPRESGDGEAT